MFWQNEFALVHVFSPIFNVSGLSAYWRRMKRKEIALQSLDSSQPHPTYSA